MVTSTSPISPSNVRHLPSESIPFKKIAIIAAIAIVVFIGLAALFCCCCCCCSRASKKYTPPLDPSDFDRRRPTYDFESNPPDYSPPAPSSNNDINHKGFLDCTKLGDAIKLKNTDKIKSLINQGADVNLSFGYFPSERTPLQYAVENKQLEIAKILLANGAAVDGTCNTESYIRDIHSQTPLEIAINKNFPEIIDLLVEKGASVENVNLVDAILMKSTKLTDKVIKNTSDFNILGKKYPYFTPLGAAHHIDDMNLFIRLINKGADCNSQSKQRSSETPIFLAIEKGWHDAVTALIQKGVNLEPKNSYTPSPLMTAFDKNDKKMAKILIKAKARYTTDSRYPGTELEEALTKKGWSDLKQFIPASFARKPKPKPSSSNYTAGSSSGFYNTSSSTGGYGYSTSSNYGSSSSSSDPFEDFFAQFFPGFSSGKNTSSSTNQPEDPKVTEWKNHRSKIMKTLKDDGAGPTVKYKTYKKKVFTAESAQELFDNPTSLQAAKKTYRTVSIAFHPDKLESTTFKEEGTELFKFYQLTYELLETKLSKN